MSKVRIVEFIGFEFPSNHVNDKCSADFSCDTTSHRAMMSTAAGLLSIEQFREQFQNAAKPNFEYWDGEARQKAMPTKLHAKLQRLLANMLAELGYFAFTELTLRIDSDWEPVPDVVATAIDYRSRAP